MSIVSPFPGVKIEIEIDRGTGVTNMKCSELIPFEMIVQAFAAMRLQIIQDQTKKSPRTFPVGQPLPFEQLVHFCATLELEASQSRIAQLNKGVTSTNPFENPGKPAGKPAENPGGNA